MKRLLMILAALALALTFSLVSASPSQAAWSSGRCDINNNKGYQICTWVYTTPSGGGVKATAAQICVNFYNGGTNTRKAFNNSIVFTGSSGNWLGSSNLYDTDVNTCTQTYFTGGGFQMGKGACYKVSGTVDYMSWFDDPWDIKGNVISGLC